jgi:RNA polymerase sigma factor (sigma-70 family)
VPKPSNEISNKIINGCAKGKSRSQEVLYKQFYAYGMSICLRYAHSREEAVEIMNDGFIKVFNNIANYKTEHSFKGWFRKILVNTAIDHYRKNNKHYNHFDEEIIDEEVFDLSAVSSLELDDLMNLLNSLPEQYKLTFNLFEIEGYSHEEIAKMLNIAIGTSRSNLARAKKMLRRAYAVNFLQPDKLIVNY